MSLQIADPILVNKVEQIARLAGLSPTAAVERAVDHLLSDLSAKRLGSERMAELLDQIDRIPERTDACNPLSWDDMGLPQ